MFSVLHECVFTYRRARVRLHPQLVQPYKVQLQTGHGDLSPSLYKGRHCHEYRKEGVMWAVVSV